MNKTLTADLNRLIEQIAEIRFACGAYRCVLEGEPTDELLASGERNPFVFTRVEAVDGTHVARVVTLKQEESPDVWEAFQEVLWIRHRVEHLDATSGGNSTVGLLRQVSLPTERTP